MSKERVKERIKVMQAWLDGKTIQMKEYDNSWCDLPNPTFSALCEYRVKPEPRKFLVKINPPGKADKIYDYHGAPFSSDLILVQEIIRD